MQTQKRTDNIMQVYRDISYRDWTCPGIKVQFMETYKDSNLDELKREDFKQKHMQTHADTLIHKAYE